MEENQLNRVLDAYFTDPQQVSTVLEKLSKGELVYLSKELLDRYANDLNSSTLRELITLLKAGYTPTGLKLGSNGTRGNEFCEVKPVNTRSGSPKKLNGGGNFTDFTPERLGEYLRQQLNLLVSGFVDGMLVYILEFPFNHPTLVARLREQLERQFPGGVRPRGRYLRSADFNFRHYQDCPNLNTIYITPRLDVVKEHLTRPLYNFLIIRARN